MNTLQIKYKIYDFNLTLSSTGAAAMVSAVRYNYSRRFPAVFSSNWLGVTFAESCPMFVYSIFVRVFRDEPSGRTF